MARLEPALEYVLSHEGWYANNPKDPGGETWRGIARRFWPTWVGWQLIDAAKSEPGFPNSLRARADLQKLVEDFYRQNFWPALYDQVENQNIATRLFDFGVNADLRVAVRAMQESVKPFVAGPIVVDGKFGNQTLGAINSIEPERLAKEFRARKTLHYAAVGIRRFIKHLKDAGWLRVVPDGAIEQAVDYAMTFMLGWMRRAMA